MVKDDLSKAANLIKHLESQRESSEFLAPVDYKGLGLDDYPQVVKTPMDLSTVRKKLKTGKYQRLTEVVGDICLIWENCRAYNALGSTIVLQAEAMESVMRSYCLKHNIALELLKKRGEALESLNEPIEISIEEKVQLCDRIRHVSHETLAQIVQTVENDCSQALEDLDKDRLQLRVDLLDGETFRKVAE